MLLPLALKDERQAYGPGEHIRVRRPHLSRPQFSSAMSVQSSVNRDGVGRGTLYPTYLGQPRRARSRSDMVAVPGVDPP